MRIVFYNLLWLIFLLVASDGVASDGVAREGVKAGKDEYFYIRVFGGFFPIPTRYHLYINNDNGVSDVAKVIHLRSPTYRFDLSKVNDSYLDDDPMMNSGYISVGFNLDRTSVAGLKLFKKIKKYGLDVELYKLMAQEDRPTANVNVVVISDGVNYISIIDQDLSLWLKLMQQYARFNAIDSVREE